MWLCYFDSPNLYSRFRNEYLNLCWKYRHPPISDLYWYRSCKGRLENYYFDKDTIVTLVGRFILAPLIMFLVLKFFAPNMATVEFKTFMIQSATPALAVLPILANQGKGDVEFSTNVVTLSTVLFIVVIPILQTLLG